MVKLITMFNFLNTLLHLLGTISPILMRTNTKRFDSLKYPAVLTILSVGILSYYFRVSIVVASSLIFFYSMVVSGGILLFMRKYDFIKSLSLSVALGFVASGLWEIPIILHTIFYRGYIDRVIPLHSIYLIPLLLLISDIKIEISIKNILTVFFMMFFNCLMLIIHIKIHGPDIWIVRGFYENIFLWICRPVTAISLYSIYYGGELKRFMTK